MSEIQNGINTELTGEEKKEIAMQVQTSGDEGDFASALEEYERESALQKVKNSIPRSFPPDFDGTCIECGEEIPQVRLKLFCTRCVDCQNEFEKKNKQSFIRNRMDSFGVS